MCGNTNSTCDGECQAGYYGSSTGNTDSTCDGECPGSEAGETDCDVLVSQASAVSALSANGAFVPPLLLMGAAALTW